MDREDFIERVAAKTGLSPSDAGKAVEAFMETFTETLNGDAANLKGAKLANADLRDVNLGPLLISNDRLLPARLEHADARYADFRGADLRQTVLAESDLAFADLTGAKLRATDFRGAILQGIKLSLDGAVEAAADGAPLGAAASEGPGVGWAFTSVRSVRSVFGIALRDTPRDARIR